MIEKNKGAGQKQSGGKPLVSIIVPTWNEEENILQCLESLRKQEGPFEVIVSDGGSVDQTCELAEGKALVFQGRKGRGPQLNAGAASAKGDILLFLHADCWLDPDALFKMRELLEKGIFRAGCFRQRVESPSLLFRFVEAAAFVRAKWFGVVYGDSGLFLTKWQFEQCGGFPNDPLFEDIGISRRLQRLPGKIGICDARVHIAARRWQDMGFWRTTFRNWKLFYLFCRGVDPHDLSRRYERR